MFYMFQGVKCLFKGKGEPLKLKKCCKKVHTFTHVAIFMTPLFVTPFVSRVTHCCSMQTDTASGLQAEATGGGMFSHSALQWKTNGSMNPLRIQAGAGCASCFYWINVTGQTRTIRVSKLVNPTSTHCFRRVTSIITFRALRTNPSVKWSVKVRCTAKTVHLQAVAEWCGERAQIQLVRLSQPKSSGPSCHIWRRRHSCQCKTPPLHFTENILVQTEGEVGEDEREKENGSNSVVFEFSP